jgi:hypothetical protein
MPAECKYIVQFLTPSLTLLYSGNAAVSRNRHLMAISTLDNGVKIRQMDDNGPISSVEKGCYKIATGRDYLKLMPHTPLAITRAHVTVSGSPVGQIVFLSAQGEVMHDFVFGTFVPYVLLVDMFSQLFLSIIEYNLSVQGILVRLTFTFYSDII